MERTHRDCSICDDTFLKKEITKLIYADNAETEEVVNLKQRDP